MGIRHILIVDDEPLMRKFLCETLTRGGYEVAVATDGRQGLQMLARETYDLVFTDLKMPKVSGMDILKAARRASADTVVVIMTAYATVQNAVEAMKLGAFDYLIKPFSPDQIELLVKKVSERQRLIDENVYLRSEILKEHGFGEIVGQTAVMKEIYHLIEKVADSRATILIQGESGTGKELVARAIHYSSCRATKPFIKVNCAALPETLLESELFGHEKGAFTSAYARRQGRFELAHEGTLLLDEISEIPLSVQAKLLRVLQEREFERVGGSKSIQVEVRIISTTNRNLDEEIEQKRFRKDLYYRLNVIPMAIPPLRERLDDVALLAKHFVERYCCENNKALKRLSEAAIERLCGYHWPGNVRELQNVVERAVVLDFGEEMLPAHLALHLNGARPPADVAEGPVDAVGQTLAEMEKRLILKTLRDLDGNRGRTADRLRISVRTLRNKLSQYKAAGEVLAL